MDALSVTKPVGYFQSTFLGSIFDGLRHKTLKMLFIPICMVCNELCNNFFHEVFLENEISHKLFLPSFKKDEVIYPVPVLQG